MFDEFVSCDPCIVSYGGWTIVPLRSYKLLRRTRCHPIGSKERGGDVCIHRVAVFRSNKSSRLVSPSFPWLGCRCFFSLSPLPAPIPTLVYPSERAFFIPTCFSVLRSAYVRDFLRESDTRFGCCMSWIMLNGVRS